MNKAENEDMVKRICEELPFEPVDITDRLPDELKSSAKSCAPGSKVGADTKGCIQLIPGEHGTDGFFIAKLKRTE